MSDLSHFQSLEKNGAEFVSVCSKQHQYQLTSRKWAIVPNEHAKKPFAHDECDLCEMDAGFMPYRLSDLLKRKLVSQRWE